MSPDTEFENYLLKKSQKIKINSNDIKKGDIFLALKGSKTHGNYFIDDSIKKGAKYCITNKQYKSNKISKKIILVRDIFDYLIKLAKIKRSLYKGSVVGITGSAGKTTLKETLSFYLKKEFNTYTSKKSYNNLLGILISILNLDLNSKYAIFEIGTNNFGEIAELTSLVKPFYVFLTNIQSTHLANFKNKKNIAKEKSNIFLSKNNPNAKFLFLQNISKEEKFVMTLAKKQNLKIITLGDLSSDCFIQNISSVENNFKVSVSVFGKKYKIILKNKSEYRINNTLFSLAFYIKNKLKVTNILKNAKFLSPVEGRGKIYNLKINNKKIKFIDDSYNANPDTMIQSINYFIDLDYNINKKILILGDMNELGSSSHKFHLKIIKYIENANINEIILCGELFKTAVNKLKKSNKKYMIKHNKDQIIKYVKDKIHKNAILMVKSSNATEVNKFAKKIIEIGGR